MERLHSQAWLQSDPQKLAKVSKMHVNFLHPFFKSRVDCDVVSSDGYSVANLVSLDFRESSRGFLAAHFIKPPALLLFQLPFPVHVESLIIKPKVGSQISSGIAVLVAGIATKGVPTKKGDSSALLSKKKIRKNELLSDSNKVVVSQQGTTGKETSNPNHNSYELDITAASVKSEHSQLFTQVAWLNDREGKTIHIQNRLFQERCPFQGYHPIERSDFHQGEFQRLYLLQKVTHVALKIVRLCGSVPAIGKVEIWGQPSSGCKPGVLECALDIQEKIQAGEIVKIAAVEAQHNRTIKDSEHHTLLPVVNSSSSSIPEDFIDPITCEIMTIPLLLPSGHNIDTDTLEKHIIAERSWGRSPSDPFTGKVFSDISKPVPNSALKVRIDKFLLSSGANTSGYGRTVGRDNGSSRASTHPINSHPLKTNGKASSGESNNSVRHSRDLSGTLELFGAKCQQQRVSNSSVHVLEQTGTALKKKQKNPQ